MMKKKNKGELCSSPLSFPSDPTFLVPSFYWFRLAKAVKSA